MKHRVAICLSGLVGNSKGKSHDYEDNDETVLELCLPHWNFFAKNYQCDFFVHTWSGHLKTNIIDGFKPISILCEDQPQFDIPKYVPGSQARKHAHWCRWYSVDKVVKLKTQYEISNNFVYDSVMVSRFDIAWMKSIDFKYLNMNKMWLARWFENGNQVCSKNYKCKDLWFFSSSKNIDNFSTLYFKLNEYCKPNGSRINPAMGISSHYLMTHHINKLKLDVDYILEARDNFNRCDFPLIRYKYFSAKI